MDSASIRLSVGQPQQGKLVVRIDGRLNAATVSQAQEFMARTPESKPGALIIDLGGLLSLDADGRQFLLSLKAAGCRLSGGSLYIDRLLMESDK
jgi:anti-anti-sigma regulatory factor